MSTERDGTGPGQGIPFSPPQRGSRSIEACDVLRLIGPGDKFEFFRALSLQQTKGQREQATTNNMKQ